MGIHKVVAGPEVRHTRSTRRLVSRRIPLFWGRQAPLSFS